MAVEHAAVADQELLEVDECDELVFEAHPKIASSQFKSGLLASHAIRLI